MAGNTKILSIYQHRSQLAESALRSSYYKPVFLNLCETAAR